MTFLSIHPESVRISKVFCYFQGVQKDPSIMKWVKFSKKIRKKSTFFRSAQSQKLCAMVFIISYYMYLNRMLQFQKLLSNQGVKTTKNCPAINFSSKFWNFSSHFCNILFLFFQIFRTWSMIYYKLDLLQS